MCVCVCVCVITTNDSIAVIIGWLKILQEI